MLDLRDLESDPVLAADEHAFLSALGYPGGRLPRLDEKERAWYRAFWRGRAEGGGEHVEAKGARVSRAGR